MLEDRRIKTSLFAIAADLLLTVLKASLAWVTGSAALLADALHSGTDFFVSVVLLGSLVIRYRQEKSGASSVKAKRLESTLAVFVALLILFVPIEILRNLDEHSAESLSHLWIGIGGTLVVIAIVHFMARLKTHVGHATDSPALEADGYHSKIDFFSSVAVLVSLLGMMVGIYLDEIAAVIIAVLIGIAGLELLVSGIRSLVRGEDLDALSISDILPDWLATSRLLQYIGRFGQFARRAWSRWQPFIWISAATLYFLSGFSQIPHGFEGTRLRFGEAVAGPLQPGLHYTLPWPIESVELVNADHIYSTTVGSRTFTANTNTANPRLWRDIKGTRVHEDDTEYLVTGDESLVDIVLTIQYRLNRPSAQRRRIFQIEQAIQFYAEAALWQQAAHKPFDQIFDKSHIEFADAVGQATQQSLAEAGIVIQVVDSQVQALQPPALVVGAYRDRLNAEQEKVQRVTRAQAQSEYNRLLAKAEAVTQKADNAADLLEQRLLAQGDAERFAELAQVFRQHPQSLEFELYQRTLISALSGKDILITDPKIDTRDLRVWGQSGMAGYPAGRLNP